MGLIAGVLICYLGGSLLVLKNLYLVFTSISVVEAFKRFYGAFILYVALLLLVEDRNVWWLFCWMPLFMTYTTELVLW